MAHHSPATSKHLASLETLNYGSRAEFFHSVNLLFETAPPLADSLIAKRPFSSYETLIATAKDLVAAMSAEDKLLVINAHPRIGAPPAQLSAQSYKEQGYDKDTAAQQEKLKKVLEELAVLNDEYEKKFGFRFVVFVAGRPRDALLPVIRERMNNSREQELATGLSEMMAIASDRLKKFIAEAPTVYTSERVVLPDGVKPAAVHVKAGRIVAITPRSEFLETNKVTPYQGTVVDFGDKVLMPGVVDSHVHVNEPGRTEWEGFRTATMAAIAGGVTTIVDMPLNSSPVTTTLSAVEIKAKATVAEHDEDSKHHHHHHHHHQHKSSSKLYADTALLGGVIPGNRSQIAPMIHDGGVVGFKCFMIHSGLDEFPHVIEHDIRGALEEIKKSNANVVMMFHAEVENPMFAIRDQLISMNPRKYSTFLKSRPRECENQAIALIIKLAREYQVRCHVVHLASSDAIEMIRKARAEGVPISAETTYHYLHFTAEQINDDKTLLKCCPPIRERENREKLWAAVKEGVITQVVSDHSPCTPELKKGDFNSSWGGISSLQLGLPIIWSQCKSRGYSISDLAKWMCENTADLVALGNRKGRLAVGFDADFCVWSPEESFVVQTDTLYVRNTQNSAYAGETLFGVVHQTYLSGTKVFDLTSAERFVAAASGKLLMHGTRVDPTQVHIKPKEAPLN